MRSHIVACHPAEVASPALTLAVITASTQVYSPVKDERLTRPDLELLVKPVFCHTRHGGCEQLTHSRHAVTGLSWIRSRVFQIRVERAIHPATNAIGKAKPLVCFLVQCWSVWWRVH